VLLLPPLPLTHGCAGADVQGSPFPAQVRIRKVINQLPVYVDAWEHLMSWHGNGSTFDLVLDRDTTRELINVLRR